MAVVVFYEKPGCSGNARQKALLEAAGHTLVVKDLLRTPWARMQLLSFFESLPVAQWFNRNSPAVKSGEIVPEDCDEATALALLQAHPLLIRRPLLEVDGVRRVGFDAAAIDAWIGLAGAPLDDNLEACRHGTDGHRCSGHDGESGGEHDHEPCAALAG
ncbi:MAG: ArsC/Spx/MgsR family protein [Rhodocyclaceae bacterium]|nr:ArsC/Spx/MgsR family protein [Rhodocyclaceae bacterium]